MVLKARNAPRVPRPVGRKDTFIVQDPFGATLPQLLVWRNSPALIPVNPIPVTPSATDPELDTVTTAGELVESRVVGWKVIDGGVQLAFGINPTWAVFDHPE